MKKYPKIRYISILAMALSSAYLFILLFLSSISQANVLSTLNVPSSAPLNAPPDGISECFTDGSWAIYGIIRDSVTGGPVEASVTAQNISEPPYTFWDRARYVTSEDGSIWYRHGSYGAYDVLLGANAPAPYVSSAYNADGQPPWLASGQMTIPVEPGKCIRVDISLYKQGILYGYVRDASGKIPPMNEGVVIQPASGGSLYPEVIFDMDTGYYSATLFNPGDPYILFVDLTELGTRWYYAGTNDRNQATVLYINPGDMKQVDLTVPLLPTSTATATPITTPPPIPTSTPTGSTISGRITDKQGRALPNVMVYSNSGLSVQTDSNGMYMFSNMGGGTYVLTTSIEGFEVMPPIRTVTVPPNATDQNFTQCGNLTMAQRYAPIMFFHPDELYRPIPIDIPLRYADLVHYDINVLRAIDRAAPVRVTDLLKSAFNTQDHWIDFRGNETDGMAMAYQQFGGPALTQRAYARIFCPPANSAYGMVLQYWFFYYDNPWVDNRHEGDWEMIQVMLDREQNPVAAGYSNHFVGLRRPWQYVNKQGTHPFVYVALGGHGSYFFPGIYPAPWNGIDLGAKDDATTTMQPGSPISIRMLPQRADRQSWLYFDGHWGRKYGLTNNGPLGPRHRVAEQLVGDPSLWDNPVGWFEALNRSNYITIILDSQPDSGRGVRYDGSNGLGRFSLTDSGSPATPNQKSFTVEPGTYTITENAVNGWFNASITCTPGAVATVAPGGRTVTLTVVGGDHVACTFVDQRTARIQAKKFNDLNRNGVRNSTDSWLDGWTFNLYDAAGALKGTQVTANGGAAAFANLLPGTYTLCEVQQSGWLNTRPRTFNPVFDNQPCTSVTVAPGENKTALFGNAQGAAAAESASVPANPIYVTTLPDTDDEGNDIGVIEDNVPEDEEETGTNTTPEAGTKIFLPFIQR